MNVMASRKTKIAAVVGAVALIAIVAAYVYFKNTPAARLAANRARARKGVPTDSQAVAHAAETAKILIFRDVPSWNRHPDFEESLTSLNFKFEVKRSADMATTDLSAYDVVIIPGGQWNTPFYGDYNESAARFESYVAGGGTLVLELNGAEDTAINLPGGVHMVKHGSLDNVLLIPEHPIVLAVGGNPIHANYASHGYLQGAPKNAMIIATEALKGETPDWSRPTFIEYTCGSGRVLAACQCFHDRDGSHRGPWMPAVISYAAVKKWFAPR